MSLVREAIKMRFPVPYPVLAVPSLIGEGQPQPLPALDAWVTLRRCTRVGGGGVRFPFPDERHSTPPEASEMDLLF